MTRYLLCLHRQFLFDKIHVNLQYLFSSEINTIFFVRDKLHLDIIISLTINTNKF